MEQSTIVVLYIKPKGTRHKGQMGNGTGAFTSTYIYIYNTHVRQVEVEETRLLLIFTHLI